MVAARHAAAPERFADVLDAAHGDAGEIHFDERLLHRAFPTAIAFDDGGLEGDAFQFGDLQPHFARGCHQLTAVMPASIALTGFSTLVPTGTGEFFRLLVQQFVQRFLHAVFHQFPDFPLDGFLVQLYNIPGRTL